MKSQMGEDDGRSKSFYLKIGLIGSTAILALWAISGFTINAISCSNEARGTFGDMFGAINALFTGLAFLGVVITVLMQSKELEYQRHEIRLSTQAQRESAEALKTQWKINVLSTELTTLNNLISFLNSEIDGFRRSGSMNPSQKQKYEGYVKMKSEFEAKLFSLYSEYQIFKEKLNE